MKVLVALIALASFATNSLATPEAATWRRQVLVGENADYFFRYVTIREYPPFYNLYRETLRLEKVRKSDLSIIEKFPLRHASYSQDLDTDVWSETSETLPPFDLSGYLTKNSVHLPFADDLFGWRTFSVDSSGVWEDFKDGPVKVAGRPDLLRQIPGLGDDPRVVGIESTDYRPAKDGKAFKYLRISSTSGDWDQSEDLLLVNESDVN